MMNYKQVDDLLQWLAVVMTLMGAVLTSMGGFDPWNVFAFQAGTVLWLVWSVRIRSASLIVVNAGLAVIYAGGVVRGALALIAPG